ncbi:hypothetical protein BGZ57DRAFT_797785, partial [Hyaloscypha finlandica]
MLDIARLSSFTQLSFFSHPPTHLPFSKDLDFTTINQRKIIMADPFSIIGVIGVATQIIQIGVQSGLDWKDAPADARSFMTELQALKTVLSETNINIVLNPDFVDAFYGRHSTLLSQLGPATQATNTQLMVSTCEVELRNLLEDLKKRAQGHRVGWKRLEGAFLAKKTREAVENLHRQCQTLNSMVAIDTIALGASTYKEVKGARKEQQQWQQAEENQRILAWLSQLNFEDKQKDILSKRHPGTGQWFLELDEFRKWRDGDPNTSSVLWCSGIPGVGKSVITSIVIDHLQQYFNDEDVGISFIYCDYKDRKHQTRSNLISSLVKQLASQRNAIPDEVKALFSEHKEGKTSPSLYDYSKTLSQLSNCFRRSFIIVDALDEHVDKEEDSAVQMEFLARLRQIQLQSNPKNLCRLFFTSRENQSIQTQLQHFGCGRINIRAVDSDITLFVRSRIFDSSKFRFAAQVQRDADLARTITETLIKSAQGMFLLPRLHLDRLGNQTSVRNLRDALDQLPSKLDDLYDDAMSRIKGQVQEHRDLALRSLCWISTVLRPLRLDELQHALAIQPGDHAVDEEAIPDESLITAVAAGLITIDAESGTIRLVHFTVEEYFKKKKHIWFCHSERSIAQTCITYLSFDDFKAGSCPTHHEFEARLQSYPLYNYAAHKWGHHARSASTSCHGVIEFLEKTGQVEASSQALIAVKRYSGDSLYSQAFPKQMTGLHLGAYFGVKEAVEALLHKGVETDSKDNYGQTPLSWAAQNGHEAVVKLLLETGKVDVDSKDSVHSWTPLSWAARNGHEAVVKLLLETGKVDVNSKGSNGRTPLLLAALYGHEAVVKLLLETGKVD